MYVSRGVFARFLGMKLCTAFVFEINSSVNLIGSIWQDISYPHAVWCPAI